jgi:hypothetical protein
MRRVISIEDGFHCLNQPSSTFIQNSNEMVTDTIDNNNDSNDQMSITSSLSDADETQQQQSHAPFLLLQQHHNNVEDEDDRASQTSSRDWGWFDDNDHTNTFTPKNTAHKQKDKDDYHERMMTTCDSNMAGTFHYYDFVLIELLIYVLP